MLVSLSLIASCLSAASAVTIKGAAKPNYWFSFGDSYTTTGFIVNETLPAVGNPLGNPAYPGYTGGGGSNWVDVDTTVYNKSLILTYNYAYGGATINASLVTPYLPTVLSLIDQVNEFLDTAAKKPASTPWTSEDSLFSIWIGINDIGNSYGNSGSRSAFSDLLLNQEFALVEKLYAAGARNFLWVNVPPIDRSPLVRPHRCHCLAHG
ncbi:carbohydrate esterase family 16 protein [Athelia psychrophila]|uniref:Carbohydrate esterase family 16 protein n=1 Tax=Athelia psychrophila TaxID=1759441 RepID=A0A167XCJ7_9AGAM|nr:carbohydrate esterase family 16 protein [Fibularhizoctonia sp. CBS 109695]